MAEAERDRTLERIAEIKRDQRQRGRYLGGTPPFGWKVGETGDLVAVAEQQAAIRRAAGMQMIGSWLDGSRASFRRAAPSCDGGPRNPHSQRGEPWSHVVSRAGRGLLIRPFD